MGWAEREAWPATPLAITASDESGGHPPPRRGGMDEESLPLRPTAPATDFSIEAIMARRPKSVKDVAAVTGNS
ncbi:unnamed protein product [Nezara viridula]|uniref:Uncharacterized protein n=1 Tax=Nezara viridula TaxID=85310 RepID=A0A9P0DV45_NEZVI|nr:unnamed protein product [Nezara viridula]